MIKRIYSNSPIKITPSHDTQKGQLMTNSIDRFEAMLENNRKAQRSANILFLARHVGVISDPRLVTSGKPYEVRRTWRERLLTLPWRPFKASKTVTPTLPSREIIYSETEKKVVCHPVVAEEIKKWLEEDLV